MSSAASKRWRPERRRAYVLGLLLLACGVALQLAPPPAARKPTAGFRMADWPELAGADPKLVAALEDVSLTSPDPYPSRRQKALLSRARHAGRAGARALLQALLQRYSSPRSTRIWASFWYDKTCQPFGCFLGELADAPLTRAMIRAVERPDIAFELRLSLVIALCRPEHAEALKPLVDLVLDRRTDDELKLQVLFRLPRFRRPPPARLRDALYLPFKVLDVATAGCLARMGDPEALSCILSELRSDLADYDPLYGRDSLIYGAVAGACRVLGRPLPAVPPTIEDAKEARRAWRPFMQGAYSALSRWVEENPAALDTRYEQLRRKYLDGGRRKRELALHSLQDILAAGEDFDLASASLLLAGYEKQRPEILLQLDLLSEFVRKRLAGVTDPARRIAILNEVLCHEASQNSLAFRYKTNSFLPHVLDDDTGNCLGLTTLYLAVAERLHLPLHGVLLPGHAFVRYDDGRFRRNIETTDGGITRPDRSYLRPGWPESVLRDRSKREMLSAILDNRVATDLAFGEPARARKRADAALWLDPGNAEAYQNRAAALLSSSLDADEAVLSDLQKAASLLPWDSDLQRLLAENSLGLLPPAQALSRLDDFPDLRAVCLARLRRFKEAHAVLPKDAPPTERLEISLREHPEKAEAIVCSFEKRGRPSVSTRCYAAAILLQMSPKRARSALQLLFSVQDEALRDPTPIEMLLSPDPTAKVRQRTYFLLVRAQALLATGDVAGARRSLDSAKKDAHPCRLLLEVEREVKNR